MIKNFCIFDFLEELGIFEVCFVLGFVDSGSENSGSVSLNDIVSAIIGLFSIKNGMSKLDGSSLSR